MWSKELANLEYLDPEIFIGKDKNEQKVCAFIMALALHFNDSKVLIGITLRAQAEKPNVDSICEELGEYSAFKNYLYRLIYSHIHELHYLIQQHLKEVEGIPLFKAVLRDMDTKPKANWISLVSMATDKTDEKNKWFDGMRNGLGFHYVRHKELYEGYTRWKASLTKGGVSERQEGAYISIGKSVKESRFYFADAAVDFWMRSETAKLADYEKALNDILDRNVNAVSGLITHFIEHRGGKPKKSKRPKFK